MQTLKLTLPILFFLMLADWHVSSAQNRDTVPPPDRLSRIEESVNEIRRDQLNYRIERDLLKEAFSSNYQTINVVLAIVLGLFTIIGFLGIRDIGAIRRQYQAELEKLNGVRMEFEAKISRYETEQNKVKEDYFTVLRTNEEQNRRIKVLELQEKIGSLMASRSYQRALEYAIPALEMDPENGFLLAQKGMCLWRLGDLPGAMTAFAKSIELDQNNLATVQNLLELYLITNRLGDFKTLYGKFKRAIEVIDGSANSTYFEVLEAYQRGDIAQMKTLVHTYLETLPQDKKRRTGWDFSDALNVLKPKSEEPRGILLTLLISVLQGTADPGETTKKLDEMN